MYLSEIIKEWKTNMFVSKSFSKHTVESYLIDFGLFQTFFEEYTQEKLDIERFINIDKQIIRSWFLHRRNKENSSRSISRGLSALKNLFSFLLERNIIKDHEILYMKSPKISKSLPRPLDISSLSNLIESVSDVKQTSWIVKRDKSILILIYSVGLRISEALSINIFDFTHCGDFITIHGKGSKYRNVPIIEPVRTLINDYIKENPFISNENIDKNTPLFVNKNGERLNPCSVQKLVKKIRKLLGLSDSVTPHALRHTAATHIMEQSGDLRSVQELLGHSSVSSTEIYTEVSNKYISDVYDKTHPFADKKSSNSQ